MSRGRRIATAGSLAAALLAGCTAAPPAALDPGVEIPPAYGGAAGGATAGPAVEGWWRSFGDPGLDRAVERALVSNRDLAAASARVEQALAQARIAGAAVDPQVGFGVDASRSRRNFLGFPIPGGEGGVLSTTTTSLGAALNVSWEADLWGRIRAGRSAAASGVAAAEAELAAARLSLAGQTAKAWFALVESARQVELARDNLDNRLRSRERIRRSFQAGLRPGLDLRLATASAAAAEAALAGRERQRDATRRQLELLRSAYPAGAAGEGAEERELAPPPDAVPGGLPADLVGRRPDLAALERRWEAAGWRIAEARRALYPALRLTGSAGRLSQEVEDLLKNDFSVWSLAAGLLQPIFQGGRLRGGVELAEARARELAERWSQALLAAYAEVELALAAERYLAEQDAALEVAADEALAARRMAEERYQAGLADVLLVLEAQRGANDARSRLLEVRRQRLDARVDLHLALGGGWGGAGGEPEPREAS